MYQYLLGTLLFITSASFAQTNSGQNKSTPAKPAAQKPAATSKPAASKPTQAKTPQKVVDIKPAMIKGKTIYEQYCMACHQANGSGVPGLNPPLNQTTYVLGDQNRLINIVLNGFNEEIEINGQTYSNPMPAFGTVLKDDEIADVLTYIRNSFTNKASGISSEKVKAQRNSKK